MFIAGIIHTNWASQLHKYILFCLNLITASNKYHGMWYDKYKNENKAKIVVSKYER